MANTAKPADDSVVFQTFKGLRNTVEPERLSPQELEKAVNIDLDDAGQVRRRRGQTQKIAAVSHSLVNSQDLRAFGVVSGVFCLINPDYTTTAIQSGIGNNPLNYVQIGKWLFCNSLTRAFKVDLDHLIAMPWGASNGQDKWLSPVVNPTQTLTQIRGKLLGVPPMATAMDYLNGRIYMAAGEVVWATELYLYDFVDKTKNYLMFESGVTLIGAVPSGLYVGTQTGLWWLQGVFGQMKRVLVVDHPVIPGSMVKVCADLANPTVPIDQFSPDKNAIMFMTSRGMCVGMDDGQVFNKSEDMVWFPAATKAAAMYRQQDGINQYVAVLDSGGSPVGEAAIGDYIDATIRRGGLTNELKDRVRIGDILTATIV